MQREKHTIVIGGGIVGLCSAWYLARRGRAVTLVEQDSIADSASAGNAGIVALGHLPLPRPGLVAQAIRWMLDPGSPLYIPPRLDLQLFAWLKNFHRACNAAHVKHCLQVLADLGRRSLECWEEILAVEALDPGWRRDGWLDVYRTESGRRHVQQDAEVVAGYGFEIEELSGDELRNREPAFVDDVQGAVRYTESTALDPDRFVTGLATCLAGLGVTVRQTTPVTEIVLDGGAVRGVKLPGDEFVPADDVVVAAGIWSSALARSVDVRLPMLGGKGYHLDIDLPQPCISSACVLAETLVAVNPLTNRLRLAGTVEFSGVNLTLHERRLRMLVAGARNYLRDLAEPRIQDRWCGLRPCTADGLPVVGPTPGIDGLYYATGHAKMGLTHGPATGRIVSDLILDGCTDIDISPLRLDRNL